MAYHLINAERAALIKNVLLNSELREEIRIEVPALDLCFQANSVSVTEPSSRFEGMEEAYFMNDERDEVLFVKNQKYVVFFSIGEWAYETRLPAAHICLGTTPEKFGSAYFSQLELSQALEDEDNIYIVKNLGKLAGEGAISRLNHGLGADKLTKYKRRSQLKQKLGGNIIAFEKQEWLSLCKFNKLDLINEEKYPDILQRFMCAFLLYAFTIEEIISA